jgi:hypothetical protein
MGLLNFECPNRIDDQSARHSGFLIGILYSLSRSTNFMDQTIGMKSLFLVLDRSKLEQLQRIHLFQRSLHKNHLNSFREFCVVVTTPSPPTASVTCDEFVLSLIHYDITGRSLGAPSVPSPPSGINSRLSYAKSR